MEELREVLQEKTLLKTRVLELEEQIEFYRGSSSNASETVQTLDQELENIGYFLLLKTKFKTIYYFNVFKKFIINFFI